MEDEAAQLAKLLAQVRSVTGADRALDAAVVACFGAEPDEEEDPPHYTASTDLCIALVHRVMPGWHWHVGYGPKGILPYATVSSGERLYEAIAGTVPLALLSALVQARMAETDGP